MRLSVLMGTWRFRQFQASAFALVVDLVASEYQAAGWHVRWEATGYFSITHPGLRPPPK